MREWKPRFFETLTGLTDRVRLLISFRAFKRFFPLTPQFTPHKFESGLKRHAASDNCRHRINNEHPNIGIDAASLKKSFRVDQFYLKSNCGEKDLTNWLTGSGVLHHGVHRVKRFEVHGLLHHAQAYRGLCCDRRHQWCADAGRMSLERCHQIARVQVGCSMVLTCVHQFVEVHDHFWPQKQLLVYRLDSPPKVSASDSDCCALTASAACRHPFRDTSNGTSATLVVTGALLVTRS